MRSPAHGRPAPAGRPAASRHAHDAGLLLLRLAVGLTVAARGTQKLFGWFGGGGPEGTGRTFAESGYPSGESLAVVAGLSETLGGLGLVLGLLTPLAAAAVLGTMVNAVAVKWDGGFFAPEGVEHPLVMGVAAASLALSGPGRLAVDRSVPGLRTHRLGRGAAAAALGAVTAAAVLALRS